MLRADCFGKNRHHAAAPDHLDQRADRIGFDCDSRRYSLRPQIVIHVLTRREIRTQHAQLLGRQHLGCDAVILRDEAVLAADYNAQSFYQQRFAHDVVGGARNMECDTQIDFVRCNGGSNRVERHFL